MVPEQESAMQTKAINLALQGGGSHGAFTWGVLDRFLEDERLTIEAVTGASAGAINAVVMAHGMATGGPGGARVALEQFWTRIGVIGNSSLFQRSFVDRMRGSWSIDNSPAFTAFDIMTRLVSPYDLNPLNLNPLRKLIEDIVDFAAIHHCGRMKLFISATNVRTGRVKVFSQSRLTVDKVIASTCLPLVFQAVEIDGEYYWDGGYMGNPPLWPMFYSSRSRDLVIVEINPIEREEVPRTAHEILNRLNEITFNSSLINELRSIEFVGRLVDEGALDGDRYRKFLVHMIRGGHDMSALGAASKFNAELEFIQHLKQLGRAAADAWLERNFNDIGVKGTIDLSPMIRVPRPEVVQPQVTAAE